ncbi:two-component sensor histidine kinase BarA [Limnobaculum zhutongyuii]|uniref:histidine kinase n=1 Tax=Limnobaculum zhutongyuii TaxID=2498113 RepID=A0A411WLJ2_9GAMM|nr:two-component sensor histidine kinase BarA [Limnobaculum zhutongyuii]QBH97111.1 two-component sensor histidine kinase BarA [Limnobaculum zhutongyuii]TQS88370.1 two-component sensor histidine kinase BarA [Limnobaculum zhutongyuii]
MTKYSLRARMMILILAPTLLIGLLISTFFVVHRYNELQDQLVDSGSSIIEPLAIASEYGMTFSNREGVRQLVSMLHRRHSNIVRSIAVFDTQNHLLVTSNFHQNYTLLQLPKGAAIPDDLTVTTKGDSLILRTPIVSENQLPDMDVSLEPGHSTLGYIAIELDLRTVRLQQYKEIFVATLLLSLCLCIAMLFAYRLMRDVTGPIRNMVNTVDRIRRGQLDSRVEGYMLGELDMLKNGINSMAMSLAAYHEEMQQNIDQATSDLRETLEQMEIQNVELDLAKKRAQEAARIKSEFLANMSHELRTPLNGVIGFTRQTLKTSLTPTQTDYLQTIERSANNLLNIINDVLDFSKLEAGKLVLEHIPFSLRDTVDETAILLAHSAHEKSLELTLNINNDVPDNIVGDPLRLQQVIMNLLGNAIKFTEQGNIDINIELRMLHENSADIEIQVHDTGIGISERQQSQLFQAFRQADASISRRHGGTGLGLVITQRLVKEMGGDICFHSQLHKGSTFWFHINLELSDRSILGDGRHLTKLSGQRILYVEANPAATQATLNIFQSEPVEVIHYDNFDQIPEKHQQYDIVLHGVPIATDDIDKYTNGVMKQALSLSERLILAIPNQPHMDAETLKQAGAQACLFKPLSRNRLFNALLAAQSLPEPQVSEKTHHLPLNVMAVDDNPANLKLIGVLLEDLVSNVILCHSGEEAIAQAKKHDLDIILMDIQMPEIDGIKAAELIRKLPNHITTPIVAVTAHAAIGERERLMNAGMDDYLAKPINEDMLFNVLKTQCRIPLSIQTKEPLIPVSHVETRPVSVASTSLDWELALRQAANKEDLARDLLTILVDFLSEVEERVQAVLDGNKDDDIVNIIHKLHGSCSYSGVPRLKQLCQYLESQLRNGTPAEDLEPEWMELLDEFENVRREAVDFIKTE